jgi:hypothetical protein
MKVKQCLYRPIAGPEDYRSLRLSDIEIIST